ncbi:ACP phosphodiesterase [Dyadobacter sp. CY326]|uniref:acyl carrier protein phosphodiesterase n=1 Tax=Dyadobacter sp. CY326 TaxID=2907300 RepID=UPI001F444C5C|nr:acyl carrier protein phosphodiesterase [Dyadobacter sp. CY326]MCE7064742.1 acyl carrier protein phosphodiesterase [Dyadobacter sp. CY326]
MNFLAHILLSGNKEGVIMGNYVGDFVKGRLTDERTADWDADYVTGLKLHRFIDFFTDHHDVVREATHKAALSQGKLSGIVMDIYFDYFLAKYFDNFSSQPLAAYARNMYALIERNARFVTKEMAPMVESMIRQDWLTTYASLEGVDLTFHRLSRRAPYLAPLRNAMLELRENEAFYHDKFSAFFPELQKESEQFILTH